MDFREGFRERISESQRMAVYRAIFSRRDIRRFPPTTARASMVILSAAYGWEISAAPPTILDCRATLHACRSA
jgi:hypothetical protein